MAMPHNVTVASIMSRRTGRAGQLGDSSKMSLPGKLPRASASALAATGMMPGLCGLCGLCGAARVCRGGPARG